MVKSQKKIYSTKRKSPRSKRKSSRSKRKSPRSKRKSPRSKRKSPRSKRKKVGGKLPESVEKKCVCCKKNNIETNPLIKICNNKDIFIHANCISSKNISKKKDTHNPIASKPFYNNN